MMEKTTSPVWNYVLWPRKDEEIRIKTNNVIVSPNSYSHVHAYSDNTLNYFCIEYKPPYFTWLACNAIRSKKQ